MTHEYSPSPNSILSTLWSRQIAERKRSPSSSKPRATNFNNFALIGSFDTLCRHEKALTKEIDGFTSRLETWDKGPPSTEALPARTRSAPAGGRSKPANEGGSLLPEVEEYEEFVERTGLTGGWDPVDHKRFLRILAEHGVSFAFSTMRVCSWLQPPVLIPPDSTLVLLRKFPSFLGATSFSVDVVFIPHRCHSGDRKVAIAPRWSLKIRVWELDTQGLESSWKASGCLQFESSGGISSKALCASLCMQFRRRTEH